MSNVHCTMMILTRAHVSSDGDHDFFRAVFQESGLRQFDDSDGRCILELRFLEWLRNALADMLDAVLELVVLVACHDRFGGCFFAHVVRWDLHRTSIVFFELRDLAGLAFDAGHGALYVVAMCVSAMVESVGDVVL